jgi:hypothetical protein
LLLPTPNRSLFPHENIRTGCAGSDWWISHQIVWGDAGIETFSSDQHDKSIEVAMTGAFISGPLMAVVAVFVAVVFRFRHFSIG